MCQSKQQTGGEQINRREKNSSVKTDTKAASSGSGEETANRKVPEMTHSVNRAFFFGKRLPLYGVKGHRYSPQQMSDYPQGGEGRGLTINRESI